MAKSTKGVDAPRKRSLFREADVRRAGDARPSRAAVDAQDSSRSTAPVRAVTCIFPAASARELFVSAELATQALNHFLNFGKQDPALEWIRIDAFPRETVWDDQEGREAWERANPRKG